MKASRKQITFDVFTLDSENELLWKGPERIHLRPKTFALLQYLVAHPGQLVTKNELLNAVWQDLHVGDEALKHCVSEIRRVLADNAGAPRFVETVHRRGYRFVGKTGAQRSSTADRTARAKTPVQEPTSDGLQLVGRSTELAQLHLCLSKAMSGVRQVVFISGDQGIGKSSLVDAFLEIVSRNQPGRPSEEVLIRPSIARGQCIKSHGASEAFMPVMEAITGLCHTPLRKRTIAVLCHYAPLWLLQMPSLISDTQLQSLQRANTGASRERMLREMAEALDALTEDIPLVLVLEDLHWSDHSTLDLISYWARRRARSQLLLIGTYRKEEILVADHPLKAIEQELCAHQRCHELPLSFLDEAAVGEYLSRRFHSHKLPPEIAPWVHQRTGGNPLFMVNVLDHLLARGLITQHKGHWRFESTLEEAEKTVPPTIQQIIERQFEHCTPQEQGLLQAGSVEGVEFTVAGAASALGEEADAVEKLCRALADRNQFLHPAGLRQSTRGRQTTCYRFIHAMYQSICYQLLPEELRSRYHRSVAEYIENIRHPNPGEMAARLAMHFDHGHEHSRAIGYYQRAADNANLRYAGHEALDLATRGIQLLETEPASPERTEREMCLQIARGTALMSARGLGTHEVSHAFGRARELFQELTQSQRSGKKTLLFSALYGLWTYHWVRAEYNVARSLADQLLQMATAERDTSLLSQAHHALGIILMDHGKFAAALEHLEQSTDVVSRFCAAITQWHLGYPDRALKNCEETLDFALQTRNPENCIFAQLGKARVHMARRESREALDCAQAALALAHDQGLVEQWLAPMKCIRGWAIAKLGQVNNGLEQVLQALAVFQAIGSSNLTPLLSAMAAEISLDAEQIDQGLAIVEEAHNLARNTGMNHCDAEIHRLKGELLLQRFNRHEAESCFEQAIETARKQDAKSFELRATISLAKFLLKENRQAEARERLTKICAWFTEGRDTLDMREALALFRELS